MFDCVRTVLQEHLIQILSGDRGEAATVLPNAPSKLFSASLTCGITVGRNRHVGRFRQDFEGIPNELELLVFGCVDLTVADLHRGTRWNG